MAACRNRGQAREKRWWSQPQVRPPLSLAVSPCDALDNVCQIGGLDRPPPKVTAGVPQRGRVVLLSHLLTRAGSVNPSVVQLMGTCMSSLQ